MPTPEELDAIAAKLTDHQWEVIIGLYGAPEGLAPMWFGGSDGSHHSNTARRLCERALPLVERSFGCGEWGMKKRFRSRGSCRYRLTPLGVQIEERRRELTRKRRARRSGSEDLA